MSGDPNKVHEAGISVQGKVVIAEHVDLDELKYFTTGHTAQISGKMN